MTALLSVRDLVCRYPKSATAAVDGVSFDVAEGELLALVGPSGCGKTTTLRAVAGLEPVEGGEIRLGDRRLAGPGFSVPAEARGVGLVFQDLALFPHLSALDNVAFGLRGLPSTERHARARELLALVSLQGLEARRPGALSGGQQQRVAVARALAPRPPLLLLDEPFSSLDASLREELRREVRALLKRLGTAAILVTHDRDEVFAFADRVVVMNAGRVEQVGRPDDVYAAPANAFVATLMGDCTLLPAQAEGATARCVLGVVPLAGPVSGPVQIVIRPEQVQVTPADGGMPVEGVLATVAAKRFRGSTTLLSLRLSSEAPRVLAQVAGTTRLEEGDAVHAIVSSPVRALHGGKSRERP